MWRRLIAMAVMATLLMSGAAHAQAPAGLGTEEFGLSQRQLVQAIEQVEALIAKCMRDQGFQYIAVDQDTVRAGMAADKRLPGVSEEEFVGRYGFGVSTICTPGCRRSSPPATARPASGSVSATWNTSKSLPRRPGRLQSCAARREQRCDLRGCPGDGEPFAVRRVHAQGDRPSVQAGAAKGYLLQSPGCSDQQ